MTIIGTSRYQSTTQLSRSQNYVHKVTQNCSPSLQTQYCKNVS